MAAICVSWAVRGVMIALRFALVLPCHFQKTTAPDNAV